MSEKKRKTVKKLDARTETSMKVQKKRIPAKTKDHKRFLVLKGARVLSMKLF